MDFLVGTFNTPCIYTLRFTPPSTSSPASLHIVKTSPAIGSHSWLALSTNKAFLYATAWTTPPSIAAYRITPSHGVSLLNSKPVAATSGYVTCSPTHLYSAGGPSGEVFTLAPDGSIDSLIQTLSFTSPDSSNPDGASQSDSHGNFGGLRHGAHSADLSPDGRSLYIADIGRNCLWTYSINASTTASSPHLVLGSKHISPRPTDGPRHTTPHPNGRVLYSLQEHGSMVDAFCVAEDGVTLTHVSGVKVIPKHEDPKRYWADEVRVSSTVGKGMSPRYLYASTRGLEARTKGYVAVFGLDGEGGIVGEALAIYETATSGGIANAVEPAPKRDGSDEEDVEYLALTDSQEGWVFVLDFDGRQITEVARVKLEEEGVDVVKAATAVWL